MSAIDQDIIDLFNHLNNNSFIEISDIPNIDLYMDQVTTFFDKQFEPYSLTDDERILTKTMINNYVKHKVISAPERKKYAKDQVILLVLVYFLKHTLSISDIKDLLTPLREASDVNNVRAIESVYSKLKQSQIQLLESNKEIMLTLAQSTLSDKPTNDELMQLIFALSVQSSLNKQLAETLIHKYFKSKDK